MDNGAQAAETITRVVIMGSTFILGLGGKVALSVARFAAAAMDPNAKQSGKLRLKTLLQSGSELKVFTLQGEANYQRFAKEAKDYGILYSVVRRTDEDVQGEVYDLLVRAEDASKINRVIEKFHLIEVEGSAVHVDPQTVEENRVVDARTLLSKMLSQQDNSANPTQASEESSLSDASLRTPNQANRCILYSMHQQISGIHPLTFRIHNSSVQQLPYQRRLSAFSNQIWGFQHKAEYNPSVDFCHS